MTRTLSEAAVEQALLGLAVVEHGVRHAGGRLVRTLGLGVDEAEDRRPGEPAAYQQADATDDESLHVISPPRFAAERITSDGAFGCLRATCCETRYTRR